MKIGFTGTRDGMTMAQKEALVHTLYALEPTEFHHGDCEGADSEAHDIIREFFPEVIIHVYPPVSPYKQAFKEGDIYYPPEEYLARDRRIVNNTEYLIGAPKSNDPQAKSGSWYTIRYAMKNGGPFTVLER